ncbi:Tyrosyl-tRNA synthetase,mitochondrial [Taphrina deformans PYCC 5710]|uniref:Tyrosine--tRNA ligase n=1 Tax=Taphrina deformans (strain PYCC 5710 / ATCC 11124 / CBS 356.35 / IMI 108563 / JCM 9778 / NBRC 8474) TaxID=1097556 RepID=R4XB52_TAPDE|nr:Tyrosyl-tRNA synthetase,mitochondrial [Taphrina deformans PYCC 5710]|eukprot:CCG82830.1 Tyrosyl-tRNA synthetase,mitochondrial [Taphrina deformans PYCC 5710]
MLRNGPRIIITSSRASKVPCRRSNTTLVSALQERGLVKTITSPQLGIAAEKAPISLYCGVDPTAASLHVGNLLTLIPVLHFFMRGHHAYALVGGATGKVGDPAGKSAEREKMAVRTITSNVDALSAQLTRFFENGSAYASSRGYNTERFGRMQVVNNADWYAQLNFMDFMNDVGRNVRLQSMLARDSVKNRLGSEEGMSFGEFTYQLLQAYDFWKLYSTHGVTLQIGGSDQYGNITAGIDLITRMSSQTSTPKPNNTSDQSVEMEKAFGLTVPLLTTPSGEKFGKSAGNAVWLDARMTSPFDLYQYFLKTPDTHIEAYLRLFTLLPTGEIAAIAAQHQENPAKRTANRILARELLILVHGIEAYDKVNVANRVLFPADFRDSAEPLSASTIITAFQDDPAYKKMNAKEVIGRRISSLLRDCGALSSAKEAQQMIVNGGIHCGDKKITDAKYCIEREDLLEGHLLVLRIGKNKFTFINLEKARAS